MSRSKAWFPFYPADIDADTADLSLDEFGAYVKLLSFHFLQDSIPKDTKRIASILRVSPQKARKLWSVLSRFFYEKDDRFYQKRMEREIAKAIEISGKRSKAAKKKWDAIAMQTDMHVNTQPQPHKDIKEGASAPESKKQDPKKAMFDLWVSVCKDAGVSEKNARSFLGKQLKDFPEKAVFSAVGVTCSESRSDPVAFLAGQLKANPKTGQKAPSELALLIPEHKFIGFAQSHGFSDRDFPAVPLDQCRTWLARKLKEREREAH